MKLNIEITDETTKKFTNALLELAPDIADRMSLRQWIETILNENTQEIIDKILVEPNE
jgi:hypothetical protein